jgi:hypothetical protein
MISCTFEKVSPMLQWSSFIMQYPGVVNQQLKQPIHGCIFCFGEKTIKSLGRLGNNFFASFSERS